MTADMQSGVLVGRIPGESPQAVMESAGGQPPETQAIEVAGRPALAATVETPPGAGILMDLDGLPGGDGQVLYAYVSGAPAGVDALAVARQVMERVLARM